MEATIIYLGYALLRSSSDQPERAPGKGCGSEAAAFSRSCSGWGLPAALSPTPLVVSYTTVPPLPDPASRPAIGGPFLWHYPSARADWTLSSILPCGARTFLPRQRRPPAIVCQTFRRNNQYTARRSKAQPSNVDSGTPAGSRGRSRRFNAACNGTPFR